MALHDFSLSDRLIAAGIAANVPVHIEGDPGQAKSALIESWARQWDYHCEVVTLSIRDKGDFMGMPVVADNRRMEFVPPKWALALNESGRPGLLVADEFRTGSEAHAMFLRVLQEREVGEFRLNDNVRIVAISNPVESAVNGAPLDPPVANRFLHVTWDFDFDSWSRALSTDFADGAAHDLSELAHTDPAEVRARRAKYKAQVLAFLSYDPRMRNALPRVQGTNAGADQPVDLDAASVGWPSARSWTNAIEVLAHLRTSASKNTDDPAEMAALIGLVGKPAAVAFIRWRTSQTHIDPRQVMEDPSLVDWANEPAPRLHLLLSGIAYLGAHSASRSISQWKKAVNVMIYCARKGKRDIALNGVFALVADRPPNTRLPNSATDAFGDLLAVLNRSELVQAS